MDEIIELDPEVLVEITGGMHTDPIISSEERPIKEALKPWLTPRRPSPFCD